MGSKQFIHLFSAAMVISIISACGPAETDPTTGSDVSQNQADAGVSISLDAGTSSVPDTGTSPEADAGTSDDPCAPYVDMTRGEYTCDTPFRPTTHVTLTSVNGGCMASDPSVFGGMIVPAIPSPIPDQHSYVQPQMTNGAAGSTAAIPSFEVAYHEQGADGRYTCRR